MCTANVIETIPNPLLDRMEIISIAGYITDEKVHIARDYLEKNTREACGIKPEEVSLTNPLPPPPVFFCKICAFNVTYCKNFEAFSSTPVTITWQIYT